MYCARGMQNKKTTIGIVCLLLRITMVVGMEWNKGGVEQKRPREERP